MSTAPLFPEAASTMAGRVDALYFFLLAVSIFFSLLIAGLIVFYAIRYRRRDPHSAADRATLVLVESPGSNSFEVCNVDVIAAEAHARGAVVVME